MRELFWVNHTEGVFKARAIASAFRQPDATIKRVSTIPLQFANTSGMQCIGIKRDYTSKLTVLSMIACCGCLLIPAVCTQLASMFGYEDLLKEGWDIAS